VAPYLLLRCGFGLRPDLGEAIRRPQDGHLAVAVDVRPVLPDEPADLAAGVLGVLGVRRNRERDLQVSREFRLFEHPERSGLDGAARLEQRVVVGGLPAAGQALHFARLDDTHVDLSSWMGEERFLPTKNMISGPAPN